jgi:hypothetical protein
MPTWAWILIIVVTWLPAGGSTRNVLGGRNITLNKRSVYLGWVLFVAMAAYALVLGLLILVGTVVGTADDLISFGKGIKSGFDKYLKSHTADRQSAKS